MEEKEFTGHCSQLDGRDFLGGLDVDGRYYPRLT
jgi:hypothetical protein